MICFLWIGVPTGWLATAPDLHSVVVAFRLHHSMVADPWQIANKQGDRGRHKRFGVGALPQKTIGPHSLVACMLVNVQDIHGYPSMDIHRQCEQGMTCSKTCFGCNDSECQSPQGFVFSGAKMAPVKPGGFCFRSVAVFCFLVMGRVLFPLRYPTLGRSFSKSRSVGQIGPTHKQKSKSTGYNMESDFLQHQRPHSSYWRPRELGPHFVSQQFALEDGV